MVALIRRKAAFDAAAIAVVFKNAATVMPDETAAKPLVGNAAGSAIVR